MPPTESDTFALFNNLVTQQALTNNEIRRVDGEFERVYKRVEELNAQGRDRLEQVEEQLKLTRAALDDQRSQVLVWRGQLALAAWLTGLIGFGGLATAIAAFSRLPGK
jgi:hypothetical protein